MLADLSTEQWLAHARRLLEEAHGPQAEAVTVIVRAAGGARVVYHGLSPGALAGDPSYALSPLEEEIVRVVSAGPLIAKAIAARLHVPYDSALRVILANLCERRPPVLRSGRDGYRLVARPPPVAATASSSRNSVAGRADLPERP